VVQVLEVPLYGVARRAERAEERAALADTGPSESQGDTGPQGEAHVA
jgi:hypothetical protein